ncbi:hypothetical protein [Anaerotalea alkaliphila]|uniref:Gamma-glutamylcyclotransferase n=1 Tax=Anaerotalea alkaliphila TaxID=2662126 RepID=A0A7X5KNQ2_9FIRM|nr:hypothetical protein [Anaerotalea alkaliphila]NDL68264.1 hypothetical protein [Anaerotalea alkaliphila]
MAKELVWYAAYGGCLLRERMAVFLKGGYCRHSDRMYPGCLNQSPPLEARPYTIGYPMYFGNRSEFWEDGGVAFLDLRFEDRGSTLARAYLITPEQFEGVRLQMNADHGWYDQVVDLGELEGYPIRTFTSASPHPCVPPGNRYKELLWRGLKESHPKLTELDIRTYIGGAIIL